MFLEQRVGRIEDRLGELEDQAGNPSQELLQRIGQLDNSDAQIRGEAAELRQRLAELEKLSLQSKLDHVSRLMHELENRLANAESHDSRQLGITSQQTSRIDSLEQIIAELPTDTLLPRVESIEDLLGEQRQKLADLSGQLESWDPLSLEERLEKLVDAVGSFQSFRSESHQLFEMLQNELASQAERDDQLFDLIGKLENRISELDVGQLQERMNEAETALTGFRAVVKEVRQRFEQAEQQRSEMSQRCDELEGRSLEFEEKLQSLAPLDERVVAVEEQLLELDLGPFAQRVHLLEEELGKLELGPVHERLGAVETHIQGLDPTPVYQRLHDIETVFHNHAQQLQAVPPFAETTRQRLLELSENQKEAQSHLDDHEDRLAACETLKNQLPGDVRRLEEQLASSAALYESFSKSFAQTAQELTERIKELEVDNRDLRERMRTLRVSGGGEPVSVRSADWFSRGLATLGLAGAVALGWLFFQPRSILEAQKFVLKGTDGKIYAALDSKDSRASLQMVDSTGKPQVVLASSDNGPSMRFMDATGTDRLTLASYNTDAPAVSIADARGIARIELGAEESSSVTLRDLHGERRAVLASTPKGSHLALLRPSEQPQVLIGSGAMGEGVSVYDAQKRLRVGMGITADGAAVNLFDEREHRRVVVSANEAGPALGFLGDNDQHRTTLGMSANGESVLNLHDATGAQRIVLHVSESDAKLNVLDRENNVVFATP